jgi:hypothetical protein
MLDRPALLSERRDKLIGHAVQNWMFLRFLPLFLPDVFSVCHDTMWEFLCILRQIVQLVCAHTISLPQILYLQHLIDEYLEMRKSIFPHVTLRPKHHYLSHYPWLIKQLGPLIRLWTLRMESKHVFFKRCSKSSQNFINMPKHLAEAHQLLMSYLSSSNVMSDTLDIGTKAIKFNESLLCEEILQSVNATIHDTENLFCSFTITYKGTKYNKDQYVVIRRCDADLEFGKIIMTLLDKNAIPYLVMTPMSSTTNDSLSLLVLENNISTTMVCLRIENLYDYCPLSGYAYNRKVYIVLKHAILDKPSSKIFYILCQAECLSPVAHL